MTGEWTTFFNVITPVSGAFLPLLFVALQVGSDKWVGIPLRHLAAVRNLVELSAPLIVGLFALYPGARWWLGGYIAGGFGLATTVVYLVVYLIQRHKKRPMTWYDHFGGIVGSIVPPTYYGLLIYGCYRNDEFGLQLAGWLSIWALMSGLTQSWILLVSEPASPPPSGAGASPIP